MRENIIHVIQVILSNVWTVVFFGILHLLIIERKTIFLFTKKVIKRENREIKELSPLLKSFSYIALGVLIVMGSYFIVSSILTTFFFSLSLPENSSGIPVTDFWSAVKHYADYTGLFAVIGFIASGISLILSAGGRWLVNLSKLFATLSILYIFFSAIVTYA